MIAFNDDHREAQGVQPICKVLPIAPSTYHAHVAKRPDPARLSARARRDAAMKIDIRRVFEENFRVYSVRKVWRQLKREGFDVARCTVSRLTRHMGLQGVIRGKTVKTTISDKAAPCPLDHVNRRFTLAGLFLPFQAANSGDSSLDGSDTVPRVVRRLRIRAPHVARRLRSRGIVARLDTEEVSRRWDSTFHRCRCHSRGRTTHHEPLAPNYWCRPRERRQGEQRVLQQRL